MPSSNNTNIDLPQIRTRTACVNTHMSLGELAAKTFKYYRQFAPGSRVKRPIRVNRISAQLLYSEHQRAFDAVANFFSSHGLDINPYLDFFANEIYLRESDIDTKLFSQSSIRDYSAKLQAVEKRRKIYGWFMKSVRNIVILCIKNDYMSAKDCILQLVKQRKLAQLYVSGQISKYFFAAIPNFRHLIPKLDHFAKLDFMELYDRFDMYNTEINDAFLKYRNRTVNPFQIVDAKLAECRLKISEKIEAGNH